jgi:energy-coupling factor transporter ATP-binding protein EcfA2
MGRIKKIIIENFRSIQKIEFEPKNLNLFVGQNDSGKSNVLRAVNLFFNGETDLNTPYSFERDFCYFTNNTQGKTLKTVITVHINPYYNNPEEKLEIVCTKEWTKHDFTERREVFDITSGKSARFPRNSRNWSWLNKWQFFYVPANKSRAYFDSIIKRLEAITQQLIHEKMDEHRKEYQEEIHGTIAPIVTGKLSDKFNVKLEPKIEAVFTSKGYNNSDVDIHTRGDGIKVKFILEVLESIANHYSVISKRGTIPTTIFWGLEEPENFLEMKLAFEIANSLKSSSKYITSFVSTHSPVFYSLYESDESNIVGYHMSREGKEGGGKSKATLLTEKTKNEVHSNTGVLQFITPYIEIARKDLEQKMLFQERQIEELEKVQDNTKCLVMTEDSDKDNHRELRNLLISNGFQMDETEIESYEAKGNLKASVKAVDILLKKRTDIQKVVFHRDRDVNEHEVSWFEKKKNPKYHLFLTENYDIESYFLNENHLKLCYETTGIDYQEVIDRCTEENKEKSIGKIESDLIEAVLDNYKTYAEGREYSKKEIKKAKQNATNLYETQPLRYRYGKTILNMVLNELSSKTKKASGTAFTPSDFLEIEELKKIAQQIWG